jgi:hypothetical protein
MLAVGYTCCYGQALPQNTLPVTAAVTLDGANVQLPAFFHHDASVLVIGFSKRSSDETREWSKRLFEAEKNKGRSDVYGLIMLARVPRFARGFVTNSIRRDVSPAVQSHFVTVTDNEEAWRKTLQVTSDEEAYLLVVSGQGSVVWRGHGNYSDKILAVIEEELQKAQASEPHTLAVYPHLPPLDSAVVRKTASVGTR